MKTKTCSQCGLPKGITAFYKDKSKPDGRENRCKICKKENRNLESNRNAYYRNREYYKRYRQRTQDFIQEVRTFLGCKFCPETDTVCLDFHHLYNKNFDITKVNSKNAVLREMKKCVCVCSNCHRKIHANKIIITPNDAIEVEQFGKDPCVKQGSLPWIKLTPPVLEPSSGPHEKQTDF